MRLADCTTLRLGGPAREFLRAGTEECLIEAVRSADDDGRPLLILGGGSNLVVADEGFDGTVVQVATTGVRQGPQAGLGDRSRRRGLGRGRGLDGRRGPGRPGVPVRHPGLAGATPIQNVGAYGQEVAQVITGVRAYDRVTGRSVSSRRAVRVRLPDQRVQAG